MKRNGVKNRLKQKLLNRTKEWGAYPIAVATSGLLMLGMLSIVALMLFAACRMKMTNGPSGNLPSAADAAAIDTAAADTAAADTVKASYYHRPEIPQMMTDPEQRTAYYVNHYWDAYATADTAFIHSDETEQLYADFIDVLQYVDTAEARTALQTMMRHMEADSTAYAHFCWLGEKYLYDPNSPMRNEDYYIPVLEEMVASKHLSEYDKIRPLDHLEQAMKNRPGMTATDFSYVTPSGKAGKLSLLNSDYTLLFFYDPDCTSCQEFERVLSEMPFILDIQKKGILRILAIYPDDDENEWLLKSSQMPKGWIVGWNKQGDIRSKTLYEIRATPTLYLLDKQKKVILKDATLERIIRQLTMNLQETC